MPHYLSDEELQALTPAETGAFRAPVPTQVVSNGEFNPCLRRPSSAGSRPASRAWPTSWARATG
jgi:hypothetical protein